MQVSKSSKLLFDLHSCKWSNCQACGLSKGRRHVMFFRGVIPCKVLCLLGAVDEHSDTFNGTAANVGDVSIGSIMDRIIGGFESVSITNLVSCGPGYDSDLTDVEKTACLPKLMELVGIAQPQLIVAFGKVAYSHIINNIPSVIHKLKRRPIVLHHNSPAWILTQKDIDLEVNKVKLSLRDTIERYIP